jgi:hypothetical protein
MLRLEGSVFNDSPDKKFASSNSSVKWHIHVTTSYQQAEIASIAVLCQPEQNVCETSMSIEREIIDSTVHHSSQIRQ